MRIEYAWAHGTLVIQDENGGYAFSADTWPSNLRPRDLLLCLFGQQQDGFFVCHEDHRWLHTHLGAVAGLSSAHVAGAAIENLMQFSDECPISLQASGTLAIRIFQRSFGVSEADALLVVGLNLAAMREAA